MTFKSTKYAKIMTDAKKYGLYDNIWFTLKKSVDFTVKYLGSVVQN